MMISFVFLLLLLGGGAAALGLIVFAIASRKLWIIPVAGGLVFLGLIAFGLIGWIVVGSSHRNVHTGATVVDGVGEASHILDETSGLSYSVAQGPPNFNTYVSARPNWFLILIGLILIGFIVGLVIRRGTSPAAGHGLRRAWPVVAVVLFIGFMFLARIKYEVSHSSSVGAHAARRAAADVAARQRAIMAAHQKVADQVRTQQQLVQSDIHAEMELFDAPRIPLSPDKSSPKAPAAPVTPARPTAVAKSSETPAAEIDHSATKSKKNDEKKPAATSSNKRKKSEKTPSTVSKKSPVVAQSKPAEEKVAVKESTPSSDKPVMVAEAEPDKPKPRPAWVDESPKRTGNIRREVIATELYESIDECYQAADIYLLLRTYQRLQQLTGQPHTDDRLPSLTFRNGQIVADGQIISHGNGNPNWADFRLHSLLRMGIGIDYVRREIVAKDSKNNESREYIDTVERSFGPMKKLYLQIEFTPAVDRELRRHWDAHERRERFAIASVGSLSVLGLLGVVFALLKIDTATKGYYTKRLFIGVPLAILGMFCLYAMLVEMGVDLPH